VSANKLRRNTFVRPIQLETDYYAGGLMILLGVGAAVTGAGYRFGSLARMGPGFMPVVLGVRVWRSWAS